MPHPFSLNDLAILIRGAGEIATAVACTLHRSGFSRLLMTETAAPLAVRRTVCFSETVYDATQSVEGVTARKVDNLAQAEEVLQAGQVPVLVDADALVLRDLAPQALIDAVMAKRNLGTSIDSAELVIGLGPGFYAGRDVHVVVETNRGHDLGRLIFDGPAAEDTGVPGDIGGHTVARVLRAPRDGTFESSLRIGDLVAAGQTVGSVDGAEVKAQISGALRGQIRPGARVRMGLKIGDIDPRAQIGYCYTISDKSRAIARAVLEAILMRFLADLSPVGPVSN
jgi:xanthine dehydrogenase accessory factor